MRKSYFLLTILIFSFFVIFPGMTQGASLYLSPSAGSYTVGNTFLAQVNVNTGGLAVNAAEGTLVFDTDKMEVTSISKTSSVFSLWIQEPEFSNALGTINFAGGKPSPGYSGASGIIMNVTFKAKRSGVANLTFAAGSVLADDGKGTNILSQLGDGKYTLDAMAVSPIPTPPTTPGQPPTSQKTPGLPEVFSITHPEENKWYSNNDPEFTWIIPAGVTDVSLLLHENPIGNPGPISNGKIEIKKYENIEDGVWYFHIRFKNSYGWGSILHRKVLIDTVAPDSFDLTLDNGGDPQNPKPIILFESKDAISGIDYYEIKIGDKSATTTEASTRENPYMSFLIVPGRHEVQVKVFDMAGNSSESKADIEVLPIEAPEITKIPERIDLGEVLTVEGVSKPGYKVKIFIQRGYEEPLLIDVASTTDGHFKVNIDRSLSKGDYSVWAKSEDERGALSLPTKNYPLEVGLPMLLNFGKIAIDYFNIMSTLIVLLVGTIAVIFYSWYRISVWRKRVRKETEEVSQSVNSAFRALREEVEEQISMLDRKPGLTKEEKQLRDKLDEALDISEKFIGKEIRDVGKELE